jgi:hypothetical protein
LILDRSSEQGTDGIVRDILIVIGGGGEEDEIALAAQLLAIELWDWVWLAKTGGGRRRYRRRTKITGTRRNIADG